MAQLGAPQHIDELTPDLLATSTATHKHQSST